jgi:hypothetical protein
MLLLQILRDVDIGISADVDWGKLNERGQKKSGKI